MGFLATIYGSQKNHYPCMTEMSQEWRKNDSDYVLEMTIESKRLKPISMILVSFIIYVGLQCFIWWNKNEELDSKRR